MNKGCEHCRDGKPLPIVHPRVKIDNSGYLDLTTLDDFGSWNLDVTAIFYCPMCGEKLGVGYETKRRD